MTLEVMNSDVQYVVNQIADHKLRVSDEKLDEIAPHTELDPYTRVLAADDETAVVISADDLYSIIELSLFKAIQNNQVAKNEFRDQMLWRIKQKAKVIALESE